MPPDNNNDIFSDPDFLALSDADKTDVLNQIKERTGTMPTPTIGAEENPGLGKLPSTNVPVGQTARDAAKIATTAVAGEGIGPLIGRLRSGVAPAGLRSVEDPIPGAPRTGPIDYARNAKLNRAALNAPAGNEYVGPASGGRPLARPGAVGSLSAQPAVSAAPRGPGAPPRLVKLPSEIAAEAQQGRAFETATQDIKPAARLQGMRNAGKGADTDYPAVWGLNDVGPNGEIPDELTDWALRGARRK